MASHPTDGMYLFFSIPLGLANLLFQVIERNQNNPNTPQIPSQTAVRQWVSQPRPALQTGINTTEVVQVNLKLPLSVSEVGWDALRVSSHSEIWYQDRQNNWRQVLDEARVPVTLNLSASTASAWYKAHFFCYPFIAKALQFRITRAYDPTVGNVPYCVGIRNGLIRRNIYTRSDGTQGIEPQQDPLGNTFTSYLKDWDAAKAFDNDPMTFWRSAPMPDPDAVASLFLDVREKPSGAAQVMDTLGMDPVYTGQALNVYYSNDDTEGVRKLSPISAVPTTDENTSWLMGKGRWDSSFDPGTSVYAAPMAWGPIVSQDTWIGIEWTPDFDPTDGPASNPVLFEITNAPTGGAYWPKVFYDVGAGTIVLELTNGTLTQTYTAALSPLLSQNKPLRIVVGWKYDPKHVFISVKNQIGDELAHYSADVTTLPTQMTLDGSLGFSEFRGLLTAHVVKLETWTAGQDAFQANPQVYVSPDPVLPDISGNIPATSLDNAIFAAAWAMQEFGTGGDHESRYENKTWTPVWRNFFSQKGKLYFGHQISAKYLKLEFTKLTEEAYPVYDSGIQVSYKIFPASVTSSLTQKHPGLLGVVTGLLTVGADVVLGALSGVNFLNPSSINNVVNSVFGPVATPAIVNVGAGQVITSLPNTSSLDTTGQTRSEVNTPALYRRSPMSANALAGHMLDVAGSGGSDPSQGLMSSVNTIGGAIADSFTPLLNFASNPTGVPTQGSDWWIFPGSTLKMPSILMNGLTAITQTIFGRPDTITRNRFDTTSVHRYDIKTVNRDAAIAYFAGVREVQPYVTTYIASQDPPKFHFDAYDSGQFVLTNTKSLDSGPITTAGHVYTITDSQFDNTIGNWIEAQGDWSWDGDQGHYFPGTAKVTGDGTAKVLLSTPMDVGPGAHISLSAFARWMGIAAANSSTPIAIGLYYYTGFGTTFVSSDTSGFSFADWAAHADSGVGSAWLPISHTFTVPSNVDSMRVALLVNPAATAGDVWFDTIEPGTTDAVEGTVFKDFITTSTFAKVKCTFTDSGVIRSDDMWAREDPLDFNIGATTLAYYTSTIPDVIPAGMWSDSFANWSDANYDWGMPRAVVAINVDPDRIYDGKRVLHFSRAGGAEEAGVKVRQITNFVANGLFRIGAVFLKPDDNDNQVTLRLRRVSDGVYIHEETFDPVVGYWYEKVTDFIEIPDTDDQEYTVELVLTGDDPDEFYLNDLYCEVANIRYFVRLGDSGQYLHDVTQLRYADTAIVSTTIPVNEFSVQAAIMSPSAYAYGCTLEPVYLK